MKRMGQGLRFSILNLLFFAAAMVWPNTVLEAKYSGGLGEPNDPYQIECAADLLALAADTNDYNKCFILTADINLASYSFTTAVIAHDMYSTNEDFDGNAFTGVFDGAGHKIVNLAIDTNGAENDYLGLFGYLYLEGEIKNLGLENVTVTGGDFSYYLGGLVGGNNQGNINNCYSTGTVSSGQYSQYIGGLAGWNYDSSISNCYSTVNVNSDYSSDIGGLTGGNYNNNSISNCYSTGDVNSGNDSYFVGGLTGYDDGDINNCYAAGNITSGNDSEFIGGLTGYDEGNINNCYFLDSSGPDNEYGEPLTDEQMKQQSSFVGWDFVWEIVNGPNDIWAICEGGSYPKLAWQFMPGDSDNDKNVDFVDFARMGLKWRQADSNFYCGGTDLTGDGRVDLEDIVIMCDHWLEGF